VTDADPTPDLYRLAATDPAAAHTAAKDLRTSADATSRIAALRVLALTGRELGHPSDGLALLREALATALACGLAYEAARVRSSLVGALTAHGRIDQALAEADMAAVILRGADAMTLAANRMSALARSGRLPELKALALASLAADATPTLLTNAGLALATCGDLQTAHACLTDAATQAGRAGLHHQAAVALANLAFTASRRGELRLALDLFAEAEPGLPEPRAAQLRLDRAETLVAAGRPSDARELASSTLPRLSDGDVADCMLLLARAELADGDPEQAAETAERARSAFLSHDRRGWALLAEHVLLRARWATGDRSTVFFHTAVATAERLSANGWTDEAADGRIVATRLALDLGRPTSALLSHLEPVRSGGPATLRADAWHVTALDRDRNGDRQGARQAVRTGLTLLAGHAGTASASGRPGTAHSPTALDLRADLAARAGEMAVLGLRLASSARELLAAEEERRAVPWQVSGRMGGRALLDAVGDRAFVEMLRVGHDLHAVVVAAGRHRRIDLGRHEPIAKEVRRLASAVRLLAWRPGTVPPARAAARVESLLLHPLSRILGDRELILAPADGLHALPWAALPCLAQRPFALVPGAAFLLRHGGHADLSKRGTVLVAGPGLPHADIEVEALALRHPAAATVSGTSATVERVRSALDGAGLVHLAAHGEFLPDDPLRSGIHLADGTLEVGDLLDLRRPPRIVVLSACDAARTADPEALLGTAAAFLALGTATVIASVTPVRDDQARTLMTAFHDRLAAGVPPARALAAVPRTPGVLGFQCLGVP
jgi:tetratricopeptide (TPR) repeat protein